MNDCDKRWRRLEAYLLKERKSSELITIGTVLGVMKQLYDEED